MLQEIYFMIKKIVHIVIASLILVSTLGFTINLHYCHDQLIDMAFLSPANSCCDIDGEEASQMQDTCPGCEDESISAESTDDFTVSSHTFNFENFNNSDLLISATLQYCFQDSNNPSAKEAPWYKKPPPYQEVNLSQIQSFLI